MDLILSDVKVLFTFNFTQMRKFKRCTFIQWPPLTMINPNLGQCFVMSTSTLCVAKTQHVSWNTDYALVSHCCCLRMLVCWCRCYLLLFCSADILCVNVSPQLLHGLAALSLSCPHAHAHAKQALHFSSKNKNDLHDVFFQILSTFLTNSKGLCVFYGHESIYQPVCLSVLTSFTYLSR